MIEEFMFYRPAEELQPEDILAAVSGRRTDGGCTVGYLRFGPIEKIVFVTSAYVRRTVVASQAV